MFRSISFVACLAFFLITLTNTEATPLATDEKITNPEEIPVNPEEIPANHEEIPDQPPETQINVEREEIPTIPEEIPANHEEIPDQPPETQINVELEEIPTIPEEIPANHEEIPDQPTETQINVEHEEIPDNHEEIPANHEQIPANHEERPDQPAETLINVEREEIPTNLISISTDASCIPEDVSIESFKKNMPSVEDIQEEGHNGRILILQGTHEIANRPYFVAMGALKAGADHVHVFTPESVALLTQTYSPDFAVYPYFGRDELPMIEYAISTVDVVVLGPGPGEDGFLLRDVIQMCKDLKKPLILNTGAVFDIVLNITLLKDYPEPGAILLPDQVELEALSKALGNQGLAVWGDHVSVLVKGKEDQYYSKDGVKWSIKDDTVAKHTEEQADILAGFLATFYNWALKSKACDKSPQFRREIAAFAASQLMRAVDEEAYATFGRSTTSSDILTIVHRAFRKLFG